MDAATSKQKAFIKGLFVQGGLPHWIFNPSDVWNISRQEADSLISNLRMMIKYDHEDLKEAIAQSLEGKHIFQLIPTKTVEELEEDEQVEQDEEWPDQTYGDNSEPEWANEWRTETFRKYMGAENAKL